jgi:superfamily II DNA or RNA helicase
MENIYPVHNGIRLNSLFPPTTADTQKQAQNDGIAGEEYVRASLNARRPVYNIEFLLKAEAYLLQLAYSQHKILSLSNSRTRILAHQVESTSRILAALNRRFLIADEVGLGKTVEAGLIIKELEYRHNYKRILIVCPASILHQWRHEMQSKFNDTYMIMDRKEMRRARGANPWLTHDKVICSLDFIKNRRFLRDLRSAPWDTVVFDEAHRLRRDSLKSTLAYDVAQVISEKSRAFLLLTATPFRGKLEELYYLVALLDRNILGPFRSFYFDYCLEHSDLKTLRERIAPLLVRRTKREVGGFTIRRARTIRFELYPDERMLYDETTRYVSEEFNLAVQSDNRAVGFVMCIFQKLLDSSSSALGSALANRMRRLEEAAERAGPGCRAAPGAIGETDLVENGENADRLVCLSPFKTAREMRREIATLRRLVDLAAGVSTDKKAERLVTLVRGLRQRGAEKFLIFTQFRATQEYLRGVLTGFSVELFHGSLSGEEKERAVLRFKNDVEILISTEAGGEGRNLQFCNIIINYDLPWSPLKIEQRIGRLHRLGQKKDVYIYNFSTKDTVAERVLEILNRKLRIFEESIGVPDVLLGRMEDELRLDALIMEMAAGIRTGASMKKEVERRLEMARQSYEKISELAVADRIDFNYDEYYRVTMKERAFSNRRIEHFVNVLMQTDEYSSRLIRRERGGLYRVFSEGESGASAWRQGTFDSATALEREELEFLAFGHPVVDRLVARCRNGEFGGATGIRVVHSRVPFYGMVFYYLATFKAASESRAIIPVAVPDDPRVSEDVMEEIERSVMDQDCTAAAPGPGLPEPDMRRGFEAYFIAARKRLQKKIEEMKGNIAGKLGESLDPEIEKIRESYDLRMAELEEKLELLEAQYKWYGRNLKGTITRTKNLIAKTAADRESLIRTYRGYLGVEHSVELVCAGILLSRRD